MIKINFYFFFNLFSFFLFLVLRVRVKTHEYKKRYMEEQHHTMSITYIDLKAHIW